MHFYLAGCWGFSEDDANGDDDRDGGDDESSFYAAGNNISGLGPRLAPRPDDGDTEDEKVGEIPSNKLREIRIPASGRLVGDNLLLRLFLELEPSLLPKSSPSGISCFHLAAA